MTNAKAVLFTNWTDEDFTHTWDRVPYTFKAGQSVYIQDYLANHFAKHLTDREMNKLKIPTNHSMRNSLLKKCFGESEIEAESAEKLEMKLSNTPAITDPSSEIEGEVKKEKKRGRPSKKEQVDQEENFEGLNE